MTRRMLINAQNPEELRVAIVSGNKLDTYQVEVAERGLTRGNIYRGTIAGIQPSLNAAFIDYGAERNGFLAIQDVVEQAFYKDPPKGRRPKIEEVLEKGRSIVVQVVKEPEGQKGAALTTNLSLAGRYLVLTPFGSTLGVSRKVEDDQTRRSLRKQAAKLDVPEGCGVIVRTKALNQNKTALTRDLNALLRLWKQISAAARESQGAHLIYSDQDLILQALRDYLDSDIAEILVDDADAYKKTQDYLRAFAPRTKTELIHYQERRPLFSEYDLEGQIALIYQRSVGLPSGGSIVIDRTEALTAVDVNSGRANKASTQAETALATNLEAAEEVARQLRLRDIGGLVVVDFIDMRNTRHQRKVEKVLRDAMKPDRARSTVGRLSANGLLEINRQRIQQALHMRTHVSCSHCGGTGRVPTPEMVGLNLLRRLEARAANGRLQAARFGLQPEIANAVQNSRRREIAALEREFGVEVEIIASPRLSPLDLDVEWVEREPEADGDVPPDLPTPEEWRARQERLQEAQEEEEKARARTREALKEATRSSGKGRRKSRGGRRKGRGGGRAKADGGESAAKAPRKKAQGEAGGSEDGSAQAGEAAASGSRTPRRRRRGGRRRGRARSARGGSSGDSPSSESSGGSSSGGESS